MTLRSEFVQRFSLTRQSSEGISVAWWGSSHGKPRRVKDIDWVVDTSSADLSELKTAINKTADGLWMKTPSQPSGQLPRRGCRQSTSR